MTIRPSMPAFPYNPQKLPRELKRYYLSASEQDLQEMLDFCGHKKLEDVFAHLPQDIRMERMQGLGDELSYDDLAKHLFELSEKNQVQTSFIGDGLKNYQVHPIVPFVSGLRGLTTAYTPYQPERSQGTLQTLWLYSSALSMLTGFEAINASLYDRATCLHEALNCAQRLVKDSTTALVCESLYPGDLQVLKTVTKHTSLHIKLVPLNKETGLTDMKILAELVQNTPHLCAVAFPQVNSLGNLEEVDQITDLCRQHKLQAVGVIDPMLLASGGLKAPSDWGTQALGCHMIVGEGQHLAIGPNFGGPGLGVFGIRYNEQDKLSIRQTAGRFVGKAQDLSGRPCKAMVLSTREQHIRREKATSNICSNQSFVATLAGASILARGESGMKRAITTAHEQAKRMAQVLSSHEAVELRFPKTAFFNEFVLRLPVPAHKLIQEARQEGLHLGVDVSARTGNPHDLLLSFFDIHTESDLKTLQDFFTRHFGPSLGKGQAPATIPQNLLRTTPVGLPEFSEQELKNYYTELSQQNVSPDENIYPLGSCTMKYNPYINDWAAGLNGFSQLHPEVPEQDAQGSLELLYRIQESFKAITGLPGVTTQPVAGAQGELVGLKLFQAYHEDRGEKRDIMLIPRSAHGTNPATATMAGFDVQGLVVIEANQHGQMDMHQLQEMVTKYGKRIAGIMVTNPNTSGVFENDFKKMAELIHSVGGLVYMDGANMNAIAGHVDLRKLGVDAVHNNLHKTWTIPHGGGGPGDAIVAVSEPLIPYLPGIQVKKEGNRFISVIPPKTIGSIHRHFGNFGHKVRAYTYLRALGPEGTKKMSAVAVLSAQYLHKKLSKVFPTLPIGAESVPRMHEFILTLSKEMFERIEKSGTPKAQIIAKIGKLFLDFGLHAPTVAFPEVYGLMIEPTESFSKKELDRFADVVTCIAKILQEHPEVLQTVPHFTPIDKVDEVLANKNLVLSEKLEKLEPVLPNRLSPLKLSEMNVDEVYQEILKAHKARVS